MLKNVAGQKWEVFAINESTSNPVDGDEANITAEIKIGAAGSPTALADVNPTPVPGKAGYYLFDLSQAETNANQIWLYPVSSTSGVRVIPSPGTYSPQQQPGVPVVFVSPYNSQSETLEIVQNVDYKSGTPIGPLKFDLSQWSNIAEGDVVKFAATFDSGNQSVNVSGTVQDESGVLFAHIELSKDTHTNFTLENDDLDARFWLNHVDGSGNESPLLSARKLIVLTSDVGG